MRRSYNVITDVCYAVGSNNNHLFLPIHGFTMCLPSSTRHQQLGKQLWFKRDATRKSARAMPVPVPCAKYSPL